MFHKFLHRRNTCKKKLGIARQAN